MNLSQIGVRRPVMTLMIFIGIIIIGGISLSLLGIDLFPDITPPIASVMTTYEGAGAEDVEKKVTEVLEGSLSTVPNIKKVSSTSKEGFSIITLEFKYGTNMDTALSDIRGYIDLVQGYLPDGVERPTVFKFDMSMMPILVLSVTAEQNVNNMREILDEEFIEPLKRVKGVGTVAMRGGPIREIRVYFNRDKLNDLGMDINSVAGIIAAQNTDTPAGNIKNERRNYVLRIPGEIESPEYIEHIALGTYNGKKVRLRDVARVEDGYFEDDREINIDGKRGMVVMLQKQSGANTVEVAKKAAEKIEELKTRLPADMDVKVAYDGSEFISDSISNLQRTLFTGGILVIFVVLLFLRNIRGSLIISLMIPVSLIVAFILMFVNGYTINIISLSALAVAIGMVVDNGIVVLENIYRHLGRGVSRREAAMYGASEVGSAILASTLTTIVIFLPIFFINDISAIMFKQLGFSIIIVLIGSFVTAMMLIPMLSSKFLNRNEIKGRFAEGAEKIFVRLEKGYAKALKWAIHHRKSVITAAILIFAGSLVVFIVFGGSEFMPESDSGQIEINAVMTQGTSHDRTSEIVHEIDRICVEEVPEIDIRFSISGVSEGGMASAFGNREDINIGRYTMVLVPVKERDRSAKEIAEVLRTKLEHIKGIEKLFVSSDDPFGAMFGGGGSPVNIEIYGYDLDKTYGIAEEIQRGISKIPGIRNTDISREMGKPEIRILLNRDSVYENGLTMYGVGSQIRAQYYGITASRYREGGNEYDIFMRLEDEMRRDIETLKGTQIMTPYGRRVPLESLAGFAIESGPVDIERMEQSRVIKVTADTHGRPFGDVALDINKYLETLKTPDDIEVVLSGTFKDQQTSFMYLALAVLGGIILVYLVMAGQFESLRDPFIILGSIPFAFSGVFLILPLFGVNLSIIVFVGLILLVGIVVNNGIVLIDYTNLMRARELSLEKSILTAGETRLRPVLMTALTTIFGMLPMALSTGEGAESWVPLGLSVIGGLTFSTFVTLLLIPTLYMTFELKAARKRGEKV